MQSRARVSLDSVSDSCSKLLVNSLPETEKLWSFVDCKRTSCSDFGPGDSSQGGPVEWLRNAGRWQIILKRTSCKVESSLRSSHSFEEEETLRLFSCQVVTAPFDIGGILWWEQISLCLAEYPLKTVKVGVECWFREDQMGETLTNCHLLTVTNSLHQQQNKTVEVTRRKQGKALQS